MKPTARASLLIILSWLCQVAAVAQVIIPAVVTDSLGHPITGLGKSDFALQATEKVNLEEVEEVPLLAAGTSIPVFILFDAASMQPPKEAWMRPQLPSQKEIQTELLDVLAKAAKEHDPITLIMRSNKGLVMIHDLTTDSLVFSTAIDRVLSEKTKTTSVGQGLSSAGNPKFESEVSAEVARLRELTRYQSEDGFRPYLGNALDKLAGIQKLAELLQSSRRRKVLIWIGDCCGPLGFVDDRMVDTRSENRLDASYYSEIPIAYERMIEAANSAHMSVYPRWNGFLDELARRTGGVSLGAASTLASAIAGARKVSGPYYLLRVSVNSTNKRPFHVKLMIKVDRPDVRTRSADGFLELKR